MKGFLSVVFALILTFVFTGCSDSDIEPAHSGDLPEIRIDTNNVLIADRETWITMKFSLVDTNNPSNNIAEIPNQQIRGRGNSSWTMEPANGKKPYRLRFRDHQQQTPFGLPAARNWVLLKVGSDINTPFGFELGKRLGLQYTCSYNPVHLYLNGDYRGTYLFTEHRQADPAEKGAPGRPKVDLEEGWLIEIDRYFSEEPKFRTEKYNLPVMIKSPDVSGANLGTNAAYKFIRDDLNQLTNLMAASDFPENGYRDLVDIDTFVKYFIVQTVIINNDLFRPRAETGGEIGSTFFYKDKGGKISAGPLWDLDWSFSPWPFEGREFKPDTMPYQIHNWFSRFHEDPVFHARYKEIWNNNYQTNIATMKDFIDDYGKRVRSGALKNLERWRPNNMDSFDWHVGHIKDHFAVRSVYLHNEYNKVDVIPESKTFTSATAAQTFSLVSFGEMTNLSATLQNGSSSAFEITETITATATAEGGYIATIKIKPKEGLSAGTHTDTLILSGSNQGKTFTHNVALTR